MDTYDKKAAELIERSYQTPEIVNQCLRTLTALALARGESVLDAGCGTGLLIEQQARLVGSQGRAEGVDLSEAMLAHARERCAGLQQVKLQQGSIETLPFDNASFDAVSCTQTLLYVKDMDKALHEIHRVLKPRGRIAIIETDWDGAIINNLNPVMTRKIFDAWSLAVVNPNLPRRLEPLLERIGFGARRVEAIPVLNASYSRHSFSASMLHTFADTAVKQNTIKVEEAETWRNDIDSLIERGEYFFCVNRFLFSAIK